jgi:acyl-coenzyme A thioesterase PaaI-like protein
MINQIIPGTNVTHTRFGKGEVVKTEGEGIHKKADIFFPDYEIEFFNGTQSNSAHIHLDYVIRNGKLKISE